MIEVRGATSRAFGPPSMPLKKVFIASPTVSGIVTTAYAGTLVAVTMTLQKRNVGYRYTNFDGSDVVMARNYLSNAFLQDASASHILFVDSDMAVPQETLSVLFDSDKDFIGTVYPERQLDLEKFASYLGKGQTHRAALALSLIFNVRHFAGEVRVVNGLCRVSGIGFGCVLIAKSVFEKIIAKDGVEPLVSGKLRRSGLKGAVYDFFGEIIMESGDHLSEDYSFCERVNRTEACDIWAYVAGSVGHVGQFTYGGSYLDSLDARARAETPTPIKVAKT
jgi:hypothetical protein